LRPGFVSADLEAATVKMRTNTQRAVAAGTRIEYHVAMDDHLLYARALPLPRTSLVVHPLNGRIARVLERGGILAPLLAQLVAELQRRPDHWKSARQQATAEAAAAAAEAAAGPSQPQAWDWNGCTRDVLVARWDRRNYGHLAFAWANGRELRLLCQDPPRVGDWFCLQCWAHNSNDEQVKCASCKREGVGLLPFAGPPWAAQAWRERSQNYHRKGAQAVQRCAGCRNEQTAGRLDTVLGVWYCLRCWNHFGELNKKLRKEIPSAWFVEGGQRWAWSEDVNNNNAASHKTGYIDFLESGILETAWGRGTWELHGQDMDVAFGSPPIRHRLQRTASGFRCMESSKGGSRPRGWPLYGAPRDLSRVARVVERMRAFLLLISRALAALRSSGSRGGYSNRGAGRWLQTMLLLLGVLLLPPVAAAARQHL